MVCYILLYYKSKPSFLLYNPYSYPLAFLLKNKSVTVHKSLFDKKNGQITNFFLAPLLIGLINGQDMKPEIKWQF